MFAAINTFLAGAAILRTYTFPAGTSTFTVPAGTTSLTIASGKGADGAAGYWSGTPTTFSFILVQQDAVSSTKPYATSPTYGDIINLYGAAAYNSSSSARTISFYNGVNYYDTNVAGGNWGGPSTFGPSTLTVRGTCTQTYTLSGSVTLSTKIADYTGGGNSLDLRVTAPDYYVDPTTGANTTGFGLTFPGGSGGPASTTTFTNVTVTSGATYTIVNNGSLTIQYYA